MTHSVLLHPTGTYLTLKPTIQQGRSPQHLNGPLGPNISTTIQPGRKAPNTIRIMDSRTHYKNMLLALLLILAGLAGAIAPQTAAAKSKITFTPNTLYVPAEGGVYEVKIRCNESFWINDITTPSWIQLFTSYGLPKGSDTWFTLPFFFRPNTEGSRKGVITFKTSKGEVKFQMIQLGGAKPGSDKAIFTLSPEELDMSAYADRKIVTLSCNLAYRFVDKIDKPNWLEVEEEEIWSYDLEKSIPIISKTNVGGKREGVITFKTSEGDVKLKVTQERAARIPNPSSPSPPRS